MISSLTSAKEERTMRLTFVLLLLLAFSPSRVLAQYRPYAPPNTAFNDARARRANRDRAAAAVGTPEARSFVESYYGDQACAAIFACSQPVAQKLAEFHASGDLDRLPKPYELLQVIGFKGDD